MPKENTDHANADGGDGGRTAQASGSAEVPARAAPPAVPRQSAAWGRFLTISAWPTGAVGAVLAGVALQRWQETRRPEYALLTEAGEDLWYPAAALAGAVAVGAVLVVVYRAVVLHRPPTGKTFAPVRLFLAIAAFNAVNRHWGDDLTVRWWDFDLLIPLASASAYTLLSASRELAVLGRQHLSEVIRSPEDLRSGSYSLYLRSFEDDLARTMLEQTEHRAPGPGAVLPDLRLSGLTEEEQLAEALKPVAPMVAVGRPGERLPLVGARRLYLPIDDWQDTVRDLMLRARLVVIAVGPGAGLQWEFSEAVRLLPARRLLLLVPDRETYEQFRAAAGTALAEAAVSPAGEGVRAPWPPPALPPYPEGEPAETLSLKGAVHFDDGGSPHFVFFGSDKIWGTRHRERVLGSVRKTLGPVLDRLPVWEPWSRPEESSPGRRGCGV
ncbi:hypothetical protein [Streptomyces naphthomycinicus]|uniref:hypothetical protein n=1 Tax=Streptomyces naphthomycinicus TaxID=2872625 RepID=UPI00288C5E58|nr:hypothetical protein [Streptomyces sp. TML10]